MPPIRTYIVSKLSKNGLPYCVKTLSDLPAEDPYVLHWYLKQRVCEHHGWGTYTISRSQAYGESRGYKLIAKIRIAREAIALLRTGSSPVYPEDEEFGRKAFWENRPDLKYVRVGLRRVQSRPTLETSLSQVQVPRSMPRLKGRGAKRRGDFAWKLNILFRGTRPKPAIFGLSARD